MKKYVTDEETGRKLEAAGVTEFGKWVQITDQYKKKGVIETDKFTALALRNKRHDYDPHVAYMLEELLEMVEGGWKNLHFHNNEWCFDTAGVLNDGFIADTPLRAVAQAVIWQKER